MRCTKLPRMITGADRQTASHDRAASERAGSRAAVHTPCNAERSQSRERRAASHLCALAERILGAKLVATPLAVGALLDCKQTWILSDGAGESRAVAQLSSPLAPDMVVRGVARANALRRALDRETAAPILPTIASGAFEGASFAIWPFCERVPNRVTDWIARRTIERPVQRWLREVARQTARPVAAEHIAEQVDRPLCAMATNKWLSLRARLAARQALRRLDAGQWRPMQVAMHGDLHAGNLLIDQRGASGRAAQPWAERFVAIDFCGARAAGLPLFDLIRIAESLRTPHALLARELAAHCALLGGTVDDAPAHAAASLADLGANLECFPVELYRELADRVLGRLDKALNHRGVLA
jgi:hypothetical protein